MMCFISLNPTYCKGEAENEDEDMETLEMGKRAELGLKMRLAGRSGDVGGVEWRLLGGLCFVSLPQRETGFVLCLVHGAEGRRGDRVSRFSRHTCDVGGAYVWDCIVLWRRSVEYWVSCSFLLVRVLN